MTAIEAHAHAWTKHCAICGVRSSQGAMNPALKEAAAEVPVEAQAAAGGVMSTSPAVLGPMPCISCGERVKWIRSEGRWSLRDEDGEKHRCPA